MSYERSPRAVCSTTMGTSMLFFVSFMPDSVPHPLSGSLSRGLAVAFARAACVGVVWAFGDEAARPKGLA